MVLAFCLCLLLSAAIPSYALYVSVCRPLQQERAQLRRVLAETRTDLADERRLRADLVKWIDIETGKAPAIGKALKQRIDERLEVLRQLREQREKIGVPVTFK
jgi:hypothetical protein